MRAVRLDEPTAADPCAGVEEDRSQPALRSASRPIEIHRLIM
jgi:hypothetical protein